MYVDEVEPIVPRVFQSPRLWLDLDFFKTYQPITNGFYIFTVSFQFHFKVQICTMYHLFIMINQEDKDPCTNNFVGG